MKSLFTIIVLISSLACSNNSQNSNVHLKPAGVPDSAFWSGGVDGGNWYVIHSLNDHRKSAIISVYGDNGELIVKKEFLVNCRQDKPAVLIKDLKYQISAFDGEKIYLIALKGNEVCWMQ